MSKRRRALSPLAVALIADQAAKSAPVYSEASRRKLRAVAESVGTLIRAREDVSDKPWSDFPQSTYDLGQYHRACALHRHDGPTPDAKSDCGLPYKEPDGTVNRNGVHAAAGRIGSVKDASAAQKKAAAKTLVRAYGTLREDPPQSLSDMAKESAVSATSGRVAVVETSGSMAATSTPGHVRIALIRAGWSLNGSYYSPAVLESSAGKWRKGLQAFADHAPDSAEQDYPSGSIKNLAGVLISDATWNPATQSLEADVKLFAPWREALVDMAPYIGMSIRAWVYAEDGEAEGRRGLLVTSIAEARSVDFVTVPAAGGAILSVFEAARHGAREDANVGAWLESRLHLTLTALADDMYGDGRLTRDERIVLSGAIGDGLQAYTGRVEADAPQLYKRNRWSYPEPAATPAEEVRRAAEATVEERRSALAYVIAEKYGDEETYTWVRDYDPDRELVWFDTCPRGGENTTWQQGYAADDAGAVTLIGDPVEVIPRTVYDPAPADQEPDGDLDDSGQPAGEAVTTPAAPDDPRASDPAEDVTDGAPPTVTDPPTTEEEETGMSGTQTGAPPVQAGTAPVVDTPPTAPASEAANSAVIAAMEAMTARLTTLTEGLAAVTARADASDAENLRLRNRNTAREAVTAALSAPEVPADLREQIGPRVTAAVLADLPTTAAGELDQAALAEAVTAAITAESSYAARLLESAGVGRPSGLGSQAPQTQTVDEFEKALAEGFVALGLSPEAAKVAAHGRG